MIDCILIIDDDEPTNYLNKMILEEAGVVKKVKVAQSGLEAISILLQKNTDPIDMIFLDINMPAMDGWEFLEHYRSLIKARQISGNNIITIMLTTSLNPEDEVRARSYEEISGFVNKPMTKEKIHEIIRNNFN